MNFKMKSETKREIIIMLIVFLTMIFIIQGMANDYNERKIQELKTEKQELETERDEMFELFKKEIYDGAVMNFSPISTAPIVDSHEAGRTEKNSKGGLPVGSGIKTEISFYSEWDSCHNRTPEGCLTASGKIAKVGMVATNLYPFGTTLKVGDEIYTVEDRTAKKYSHRIDIWTGMGEEAYQLAKANGIQYKQVKIIK